MAFDKTVHHKNPRTGKVERVEPYRVHVTQRYGKCFEKKGKYFWENGQELTEDEVVKVFACKDERYHKIPTGPAALKAEAAKVKPEKKVSDLGVKDKEPVPVSFSAKKQTSGVVKAAQE